MASKIEYAKKLLDDYRESVDKIQLCLGNKKNENGEYVRDANKDEHMFKLLMDYHSCYIKFCLKAYYRYSGDSSTYYFDNCSFMENFCKAINNNMTMLIEETEKLMHNEYVKALKDAKEEADFIYSELEKLN